MTDPKRDELTVQQKKAILVALVNPANKIGKDRALDELKGLAKSAGVRVADTLVQVRDTPDPATFLGSGKVEPGA